MNLYYISQAQNNDYDTYDSAVVAADSPEEAAHIHPSGYEDRLDDDTWIAPELVKVEYLGVAKRGTKKGVICASFNAG